MAIIHLLIVEDDIEMRSMITDFLRHNGYKVSTASNKEEIYRIIKSNRIDLILLDIMLGNENGIEICKKLRSESNIPIIIISALSSDNQKMDGYEVGADDYITKPFNPKLLEARLKAVLKRARRSTSLIYRRKTERYNFSSWCFNGKTNKAISPEGYQVALSKKEINLLKALLANPYIPLTREEIADVLDIDRDTDHILNSIQSRAIDVLVGRLRTKLEKDPKNPELIKTERGVGYILASDVIVEND